LSGARWEVAQALSHEDWISFLAGRNTHHSALVELPAAPPLPPADFQAAFVGSSGLEAMQEAGEFYRRAHAVLGRGEKRTIGRLLDFGCGWGRIYRVFLRDTPELVGVDIDGRCIAACQAAMPCGSFQVCEPEPPLSFPDGSVDVVESGKLFETLRGAGTEAVRILFARAMEKSLRDLIASGKLSTLSAHAKRRRKK